MEGEEVWATNKEFYYKESREGVRWVYGGHTRISKMRSVILCLEVDGII